MEKYFFQQWNLLVHEHTKVNKIIQDKELINILYKFASQCKKKKIDRTMLFTHAWTLWTFGQATPQSVYKCLDIYDNSTE